MVAACPAIVSAFWSCPAWPRAAVTSASAVTCKDGSVTEAVKA
jgi:hypothetical protein